MAIPEGMKVHTISLVYDVNQVYKLEFPEYDLIITSRGGLGWSSSLFFTYKGVSFKPRYTSEWDSFIIEILNRLKASSDKQSIMVELIEKSMNEDQIKIFMPVIKTKNIRAEALEKEIINLRTQVKEIEYLRELADENKRLKKKFEEIGAIIKNVINGI